MHMCMGLKLRERMLRMLRGVCATSPSWNQPRCLLTVRINVLREPVEPRAGETWRDSVLSDMR